jgi:hypothetical protein
MMTRGPSPVIPAPQQLVPRTDWQSVLRRSCVTMDRGKNSFGVSTVATVARPWGIADPPSGDGSYNSGNCSSRDPIGFTLRPRKHSAVNFGSNAVCAKCRRGL